ncbi:MAG: hypothetical protein ACRD10_11130 [Terriglobia bacterium]
MDIIRRSLRVLNKPEDQIGFVKDRPGPDRRYALNTEKILQELGWKPAVALKTVRKSRSLAQYRLPEGEKSPGPAPVLHNGMSAVISWAVSR